MSFVFNKSPSELLENLFVLKTSPALFLRTEMLVGANCCHNSLSCILAALCHYLPEYDVESFYLNILKKLNLIHGCCTASIRSLQCTCFQNTSDEFLMEKPLLHIV